MQPPADLDWQFGLYMKYCKATIALFTLILQSMTGLSAAGEIYKWKNAEGCIHYGDNAHIDASATKQIKIQSTSVSSSSSSTEGIQILEPIVRPFDVYGGSASELSASLRGSGPYDAATQTWRRGRCNWGISWEFTYEEDDDQCAIDTFLLKLNTKFDLPRWRSRDSAPADFRATWDCFEKALRLHEEGNRSNAIVATKALATKLRAMAPQKDCETRDREISALRARVMAEYTRLDEAYDRATDHGISQGAKFW